MRLDRMRISGFRGIDSIDIPFDEQLTLIVGVNGVGKSSVLSAIAASMAAVTRRVYGGGNRVPVHSEDVRTGHEQSVIECDFELEGRRYSHVLTRSRTGSTVGRFLGPQPVRDDAPSALTVLFSTRRAVPSNQGPPKSASKGGALAATAGALVDHDLALGEIAQWLVAVEAIDPESPRIFASIDAAVARFLPGYSELRPTETGSALTIRRGEARIEVPRLSDGERGVLALVLDLTRRMALLEPTSADPAADSRALILIDEIDLHLHPRWQRNITVNLRRTFPQCQIVATTHSPQVVGEVEADQIRILELGDVSMPPRSFGVDSSSILEEVMDTTARNSGVEQHLAAIGDAIDKLEIPRARELLNGLAQQLSSTDAEVLRLANVIEFIED